MLTPVMTVEELLTNESFINYCKGSEQETIYWERFALEHPENIEAIETARKLFIEIFGVLAVEDMESQLEILSRKISSDPEAPVVQMSIAPGVKRRKVFLFFAKIAAIIAVIIVVYFLYNDNSSAGTPVEYTYATKAGEKKTIQLPDGSIVTLNAGSKIETASSFGVSDRAIKLTGEAFFDVKKNRQLPFIVYTSTIQVKALGTAFNVKAYPGEKKSETTLIRGLVEVTVTDKPGASVILHPNQKIQWDNREFTAIPEKAIDTSRNTKQQLSNTVTHISQTEEGDIRELAWMENKLVFSDQSLEEMAPMLERWYGVKFDFQDDVVRSYRFTATFQKENLQTVLMVLKESRDFQYHVVPGDMVTVRISR